MNTAKTLVRISGVINVVFVLFHLWLAWRFHHAMQIPAPLRVMLEIFNGCGSLSILFLALAGLLHPQEVVETRPGRLILWLGAALYLTRAVLEFVLPEAPSPAIMVTCLVAGFLYVAAWLSAARSLSPSTAAS